MSNEKIRAAHALDGGHEANNEFYRRWAMTYDVEMNDGGYVAPHMCALLTHQAALQVIQSEAPNVLDVGCGTGLVGRELQQLLPYASIVGADLSPDMAETALESGAYTDAAGDVDLNKPLPASLGTPFDIVVCCGTFSLGHVGTDGLENLVDATRPGGSIVFSVRRRHSKDHDFAGAVRSLQDRGLVQVDSWLDNAPYIDDEGADYWILRATPRAS